MIYPIFFSSYRYYILSRCSEIRWDIANIEEPSEEAWRLKKGTRLQNISTPSHIRIFSLPLLPLPPFVLPLSCQSIGMTDYMTSGEIKGKKWSDDKSNELPSIYQKLIVDESREQTGRKSEVLEWWEKANNHFVIENIDLNCYPKKNWQMELFRVVFDIHIQWDLRDKILIKFGIKPLKCG